MKIIDFFKSNIDPCERPALERAMLLSNLTRGRTFALVIMLIEGAMLLMDMGAWLLRFDERFSFMGYFLLYLLLMVASFALFLYLRKTPKIEQERDAKKARAVLLTYIVFSMCWGSVVSLFDQRLYGHVIVYMVNMITLSSIFYLNSRQILIPYIGSTLILFVGLPFYQPSSDMLVGHYFNTALFTIISFMVSRMLFASFAKDFKTGELLKKANEKLQNEILYNRIANSELVQVNRRLQEITMVDELTGIPNRRSLQNYFDITYDFYAEGQALLSVIVIDIDHFKAYNDYYGHMEGDKALMRVAKAIYIQHRNSDFVARFGGEEFIFASFNTPKETVKKIAERMRASVAALKIPHNAADGENTLTISLGACTRIIADKRDFSEVIRQADEAMYRAKANGRNRVEYC